jgi:protein-S-isoprenylcysteine O-methyltransferase Ste14
MSIVPAFELRIWNAWIFMVIFYAAAFVPLGIYNEKAEKRMEGDPTGDDQKKVTKIVNAITHMVIMPLTLIYSIFLPLQLGTWWFYVGLVIYLLGLIMVLLFSISFGTASLDKPISTGVYAVSRNPSYFAFFLAYLGTGIACASWIFILLALVWIVSWHFGVAEEEYILLEKYGDAYQKYMDQTPRWIGLPKRSSR